MAKMDTTGIRPTEAERRQFGLVRERGTVNMLNRTQVARIARNADLSALADAADGKVRYYALLDHYIAADRS